MSGSLFKNPCNMYSLFWWENCRWLVPGLGMWVIGPGQDTSMLQSIWYTPMILPRTLKTQTTEISFWLQCVLSLLSLFGASPEPQITGESGPGFFSDTKYVVSLPTAPNSPNTHWVCNKSLMELLQILQVEGSKLFSSDGSHEVLSQSSLWPNM